MNQSSDCSLARAGANSYFIQAMDREFAKDRGESVTGSTGTDQVLRGGSIPTSPLTFKLGDAKSARELVLQFHYSSRCKSGARMVGTFHRPDRQGLCVAACIFHEPPSIWRERVLELHRLVRRPRYSVPLSQLVAWTCRAVKSAEMCDLLISYADSTQGHHGGIYQACGWHYNGKRPKKLDGYFTPQGEYVPARSAVNRFGCNRRYELAARGITPHFDKGKHLYWRALTPAGAAKAERLGLVQRPYPKPTRIIPARRRFK